MEKADPKIEDEKLAELLRRILIGMYSFCREKGVFHTWLNEFEFYIKLYGVNEEQEKKLFMKMIPKEVHLDFEVKFPCFELSKKSQDEIVVKYNELLTSVTKRNHLRRSQFMTRFQYSGETVEEYAINLREIHSKCFYSDVSTLKLRKQFVRGLLDKFITKTLSSSYRQLPFNEVVKRAVEMDKEIVEKLIATQHLYTVRKIERPVKQIIIREPRFGYKRLPNLLI